MVPQTEWLLRQRCAPYNSIVIGRGTIVEIVRMTHDQSTFSGIFTPPMCLPYRVWHILITQRVTREVTPNSCQMLSSSKRWTRWTNHWAQDNEIESVGRRGHLLLRFVACSGRVGDSLFQCYFAMSRSAGDEQCVALRIVDVFSWDQRLVFKCRSQGKLYFIFFYCPPLLQVLFVFVVPQGFVGVFLAPVSLVLRFTLRWMHDARANIRVQRFTCGNCIRVHPSIVSVMSAFHTWTWCPVSPTMLILCSYLFLNKVKTGKWQTLRFYRFS
jgi:hypothetical protein